MSDRPSAVFDEDSDSDIYATQDGLDFDRGRRIAIEESVGGTSPATSPNTSPQNTPLPSPIASTASDVRQGASPSRRFPPPPRQDSAATIPVESIDGRARRRQVRRSRAVGNDSSGGAYGENDASDVSDDSDEEDYFRRRAPSQWTMLELEDDDDEYLFGDQQQNDGIDENGLVRAHVAQEDLLTFEVAYNEQRIGEYLSLQAQIWRQRIPYYLPVLQWLPKYKLENLPGDLGAGLALSCMMVPQGLAYALLAGLNRPIVGLYSAFLPVLLYACMGQSRQLSIGPEAVVSILVGGVTRSPTIGQGIEPELLASMLAVMVGVFTFLLGLFRFGFLDNMLSRPLLRGFVSAVAVIIIIEQLGLLLGIEHEGDGSELPFEILGYMLFHLGDGQPVAVAFSIATLVVLFSFNVARMLLHKNPRFKWIANIPMLAIWVGLILIICWAIRLQDNYPELVLGNVDYGFPVPRNPFAGRYNEETDEYESLGSVLGSLLVPALLISIIGFVESIVASKDYANKNKYTVSSNRELVALGVSNLFGGWFQAYPVFGSLPRTTVANAYKAKTQLAGAVVAIVVFGVLMYLVRAFEPMPKSVMGAIIVVAAVDLIELHDIPYLIRVHAWKDFGMLVITFVVTLALGVDTGILVSVAVSLFLVVKQSTVPHLDIMGRLPNSKKWRPVGPKSQVKVVKELSVVRIDDRLTFVNIGPIREMFFRIEAQSSLRFRPEKPLRDPPMAGIIINMSSVPSLDASALQTIDEMVHDWVERGVAVAFVKVCDPVHKLFEKSGIVDRIGEMSFHKSTDHAVRSLQHLLVEKNRRSNIADFDVDGDEGHFVGGQASEVEMDTFVEEGSVPDISDEDEDASRFGNIAL